VEKDPPATTTRAPSLTNRRHTASPMPFAAGEGAKWSRHGRRHGQQAMWELQQSRSAQRGNTAARLVMRPWAMTLHIFRRSIAGSRQVPHAIQQ
jgi:hypothetical protein